MKLIVAGVGPGDPGFVTVRVLNMAREADLVLIPCSRDGKTSVAGKVLQENLLGPDSMVALTPIYFPMTRDAELREAELTRQLEGLRPAWVNAKDILLAVIGDSALYATGSYLYKVLQKLVPDLELELIPGVSAHSLAASCARRFLALGEDILCVVPGTAKLERIKETLSIADAVALYKPSALKDQLRDIVTSTGPWSEAIRVDRAGLPDEKVLRGFDALEPCEEYLSLLLLFRGSE